MTENPATKYTRATRPTQPSVQLEDRPRLRAGKAIIETLFGPVASRDFSVRYWDGTLEASEARAPHFTLALKRSGALRRMFWPPSELAIGDAFVRGDYDIEGDLESAAGLADTLATRFASPAALLRLALAFRSLPRRELLRVEASATGTPDAWRGAAHTRARDAEAVRFHYDVGNDFYALWLDSHMVYSCAYFPTGTEDLDTAQEAKLEHLCRKLRLQPDEHLLDIGCGWGGLILYAAQHYGVRATGVTLSESQAALARERIRAAGLENRVRVEVRDYRDLTGEQFDKIVSVGMFEHVGRTKLTVYFRQAYRLLKPGGLFLNHGIVVTSPSLLPGAAARIAGLFWRQNSFIQRYVFPDGELVRPHEALGHAERQGFETRDVESLREHYALTLRHWVQRLETRHAEAVRLVGENTYRVWRFYMGGVAWAFAAGRIGVTQMLFAKPDASGASGLPLSRADLYRDATAAAGGTGGS